MPRPMPGDRASAKERTIPCVADLGPIVATIFVRLIALSTIAITAA